MKKLFLPVFILTCTSIYAQSERITIKEMVTVPYIDPRPPHMHSRTNVVILSNGDTLHPGTFLKLGKGTLPNGDYDFIATPSNTMEAKLKRTTTLKELKLTDLYRKGKEKYGYKYIIKTEGNYSIQLEDAIATGEIIL